MYKKRTKKKENQENPKNFRNEKTNKQTDKQKPEYRLRRRKKIYQKK